MIFRVKLKNTDHHVMIDGNVYDFLFNNSYYKEIKLLENLRLHSRGYVFFQKNRKVDGGYKIETLYLQKIIAEKFIQKPDEQNRYWVRFKDSNPLNCQLSNLEWSTLSNVVRNTNKTDNQFGYRGVVKNGNKYQAVIYVNRKPVNLGSFSTPKEAAKAYNDKSIELYGETKSLNRIKK